MDHSLTFARHFARLLWLLLTDGEAIPEQKAALRALVTVSKDGPLTLAAEGSRVVANGTPLPEALTGSQELAAQLIGHAVRRIEVRQGAVPADLLCLARILAAEPVPGDGGATVRAKLEAQGARTVTVETESSTDAPAATSAAPTVPPAAGALALEPPAAAPDESSATAAPPTVVSSTDAGPPDASSPAASSAPEGVAERLARLDATRSVSASTQLLAELATLAETAQRDGRVEVVGEVLSGLVAREGVLPPGEMRLAYTMIVRRLSTPTLLRSVARLLPRRRDLTDGLQAALRRGGETGADVLVEQLTAAPTLQERRVYFDALSACPAAVPTLVHMLGDSRWYAVRNAAELLGEMQAGDGESALAEVLGHPDERVRRAAAGALAQLGTAPALQALQGVLRDDSPQVRVQAALGLSAKRGGRSAGILARALDEEADAEVQLALLAALGRVGTSEAVQKLLKAAEPGGSLFKKKPLPYRVAAIQSLGEARTPTALGALQAMLGDKEREVREAAFRVVMHVAPRSEPVGSG